MRRRLFWWFLAIDTVLSLVMVFAYSNWLPVYLGSICMRTPLVGTVLLGTYFLVRSMSSVAPKVGPYPWFAMGIVAGYFFGFSALAVLTEGRLWNQERWVTSHTDLSIWIMMWSPYAVAFVVTSVMYFVERTRRAHVVATTP
jgi:hypothetical protein